MKSKQEIIESATVGQEITWFTGWEWRTGTVTNIVEVSPYTGKTEIIAVQVGNSCFILDASGLSDQVLINGDFDTLMKYNRSANSLERSAQKNGNCKF